MSREQYWKNIETRCKFGFFFVLSKTFSSGLMMLPRLLSSVDGCFQLRGLHMALFYIGVPPNFYRSFALPSGHIATLTAVP